MLRIHALSTKQTIYYIVLVVELLLDEKRYESGSILAFLITVLCVIRITQKLMNEDWRSKSDRPRDIGQSGRPRFCWWFVPFGFVWWIISARSRWRQKEWTQAGDVKETFVYCMRVQRGYDWSPNGCLLLLSISLAELVDELVTEYHLPTSIARYQLRGWPETRHRACSVLGELPCRAVPSLSHALSSLARDWIYWWSTIVDV